MAVFEIVLPNSNAAFYFRNIFIHDLKLHTFLVILIRKIDYKSENSSPSHNVTVYDENIKTRSRF